MADELGVLAHHPGLGTITAPPGHSAPSGQTWHTAAAGERSAAPGRPTVYVPARVLGRAREKRPWRHASHAIPSADGAQPWRQDATFRRRLKGGTSVLVTVRLMGPGWARSFRPCAKHVQITCFRSIQIHSVRFHLTA